MTRPPSATPGCSCRSPPTYPGITRGCATSRAVPPRRAARMTTAPCRDSSPRSRTAGPTCRWHTSAAGPLFGAATAVPDPGEDELVEAWAPPSRRWRPLPEVRARRAGLRWSVDCCATCRSSACTATPGWPLMLPWSAEVCLSASVSPPLPTWVGLLDASRAIVEAATTLGPAAVRVRDDEGASRPGRRPVGHLPPRGGQGPSCYSRGRPAVDGVVDGLPGDRAGTTCPHDLPDGCAPPLAQPELAAG
jgi:hypothetical protein